MSDTHADRRLAWLAWATICLVWGTTYLAIRVALESIPVFLVAGLRWMALPPELLLTMRGPMSLLLLQCQLLHKCLLLLTQALPLRAPDSLPCL